MKIKEKLIFSSIREWRNWLEANHLKKSEAGLVFVKNEAWVHNY